MEHQLITENVVIEYVSEGTYRICNLSEITRAFGYYVFTVTAVR